MTKLFYNLVYKTPSGDEIKGRKLPTKNRTIELEDGTIMSGSQVYSKFTLVGKLSFDGQFFPAKKTKHHGAWEVNQATGFKINLRLREEQKEIA
jgi:hypothetical protein